jgi:ParB/RepB/Spo0J family partition protein
MARSAARKAPVEITVETNVPGFADALNRRGVKAVPLHDYGRAKRDMFVIAKENPRSIRRPEDVASLAQNIAAHGILEPLVAYREHGKFHVTVGGTRLLAAKTANLSELPYTELSKEAAIAAGLAEQEGHTPLHAADQARAYAAELSRLNGDGPITREAAIETIANRVGRTPRFVAQRLALASLHPPILKALGEDKITLPIAAAWANAPLDRQEKAWGSSHMLRDVRAIKSALAKGRLGADADLVKFVTLKAYKDAGGELQNDLFAFASDYGREADLLSDTGKSAGVFIADSGLINRLAREKLERAAKLRAKEGWGFIETGLGEFPSKKFERAGEPKTKEARAKVGLWISIDRYEHKIKATPIRKLEPVAEAKGGKAAASKGSGKDYAAEEKARRAHNRTLKAAASLVGRSVTGGTPGLALAIIVASLASEVLELDREADAVSINPGRGADNIGLASDAAHEVERKYWQKTLQPHVSELEAYFLKRPAGDIERLLQFIVAETIWLHEWNYQKPAAHEKAKRAHLKQLAGLVTIDIDAHRTPKVADVLDSPLLRELVGAAPLVSQNPASDDAGKRDKPAAKAKKSRGSK